MATTEAFGIIDYQRGFIPLSEGQRIGDTAGFGELPVEEAPSLLPVINEATQLFYDRDAFIFNTGDSHKKGTAHISENPDFKTSWPEHCIEGTAGAEDHPGLLVAQNPDMSLRLIKGDVKAKTPAEDTSYTGALAHPVGETILLPDILRERGVTVVYLGGVALGDGEKPLCLDSTAIDLNQLGFDVTVIKDAVAPVFPENREKSYVAMAKVGIKLATLAEVRELLAAT